MRQRRPGISMISLLVIIAILGILIALLLPAVQKVREAANRTRCMNNMKILGLAFHNYNDTFNEIPSDLDQLVAKAGPPPTFKKTTSKDYPKVQSFYIPLLPFLEQAALYRQLRQELKEKVPVVPVFLCPSRGQARQGSGKALDDYGSGQHPDFFTAGKYAGVNWQPQPKEWKGAHSILGGIVYKKISITDVSNGDGTSNTFVLAHKGVEPRFYKGNGANDEGWATVGNYWEHKRFPGHFGPDGNNATGGGGPASMIMTSPHREGMPTLFCDGSVRMVNFGTQPKTLGLLWAYNDGQKVKVP